MDQTEHLPQKDYSERIRPVGPTAQMLQHPPRSLLLPLGPRTSTGWFRWDTVFHRSAVFRWRHGKTLFECGVEGADRRETHLPRDLRHAEVRLLQQSNRFLQPVHVEHLAEAGRKALPEQVRGVIITVSHMPLVIRRMVRSWDPREPEHRRRVLLPLQCLCVLFRGGTASRPRAYLSIPSRGFPGDSY